MPESTCLLNIKAVCARTGLGRTKVYELLAERRFPKPVYPTPRAPRWRSDEITAWIDRLSAARAA